MSSIIKVVKGKVEEIELPEKVDVIVSEPIGFLLVSFVILFSSALSFLLYFFLSFSFGVDWVRGCAFTFDVSPVMYT